MRDAKRLVVPMFERWIKAVGGHMATNYKDVGGYRLDYSAPYGGYHIEQVSNDQGGVHVIFERRMKATEFVTAVQFALRTIEEIEGGK